MRTSLVLTTLCCFCLAAAAKEAPVKCTPEQVAAAVLHAPAPPFKLGLQAKLVDYVDFTAADDPHDMRDHGTSRVVTGPAGRYRVTAAHRHAMFSVRWRRGTRDKPHVLVFEYPDDAKREICFFTHESGLSGRRNLDWSLETGVYCGNPLPVSGRMQYHTFYFWPDDQWPVAMVANWARCGKPAAASRLWVYEITGGLPPLRVREPDAANPRRMGIIYNWSLVPTRGIFGLANPHTAMEHIVDYSLFRGDNLISWPVVVNASWCFRCVVPAWPGGGGKKDYNRELDEILAVCDRKGMKFVPVFNRIPLKAKPGTPEHRAALEKGFTQFFERYGKHPSLWAIGFDTQDLSPKLGETALDAVRASFGGLEKFITFAHKLAPKVRVLNYLGGRTIHDQYFHDPGDVVARWEQSAKPWGDFLAAEVAGMWKSWSRDPAALNRLQGQGLTTVISYQADDHGIFDTYYQNPRAMFYYDLESAPAKSKLIDTRAALVWNTFFEGYIGMHPSNWWYLKLWVAPDFNPSEPLAMAGWARAMLHRDRDLLICGSWNRKAGGHEAAYREFARALRSLPPVELATVQAEGSTPVAVRSGVFKGKTYVSVLNPTCYEQEVRVNLGGSERKLALAPFSLQALAAPGTVEIKATGEAAPAYVQWIGKRLQRFENLLAHLKQLDAAAAPAAFAAHLAGAKRSFERKQYLQADVGLGHGLTTELELRRSILAPEQIKVPRIQAAPPLKGDLDAWPARAVDLRAADANIVSHLFFPARWSGEKDFSARVRLAHDGSKLYLGLAVKDNVLCARDGAALKLSPANYRKWRKQKERYEMSFPLPLPRGKPTVSGTGRKGFACTSRRTANGYVAEMSLDLAALGLKPGARMGWVLLLEDDDNCKYLFKAGWARKTAMLIPHRPRFAYWSDARTCGELVIE